MSFWPVVKKVVKDSDVVLEILDARMPQISRNKQLESMLRFHEKEYLMVFTKIDLVSDEALRYLRNRYANAFFVSGVKNIGLKRLKTELQIMAKRLEIEEIKVGIVGYPNVGKSAVINALAHRARAKVSRHAGTTRGIQWIKVSNLSILDSPGVVPFEDSETQLGTMGAKNPEKLKNPVKVACALIRNIREENKESLEKQFGISTEGKDDYEILLEFGKKRNFLLKGGIIDERRAAMAILADWQKGKIRV